MIVEVKAEQEPPASAVYRTFFGSTPDVRIYLGTPKANRSGLEVPQAILIWDGPGHDWRASIDRIVEDPDATRFNRPLDNLPFRAEQLGVPPDVLEEIVAAEKCGIVKWAMSPLPTRLDADQLGRSGERFMRRVNLAGKKTQQVAAHVLAFMRPREHWFGSAPAWDGNNITWGGCKILMGYPYVPLHWLDRLGVFELVIAPHISRRGPNGIWSIARGENHPLVERLRGVEFFIFGWGGGVPPQHLIYVTDSDSFDSSYLVELFRTEEAANGVDIDWGNEEPMTVQKVSGDNLLALLATADVVSIDGHEYARSLRGKAACELDEVTADEALLDLIAVAPQPKAEP
ncbi:hypothetical protein PQQ86_38965 [Paraburkholderia sediminicola]|uniref:hypothetical protein n=1 Tax=Paraburkholderia sediminicola TaxID=458836 RepID=UPI0038BAC388